MVRTLPAANTLAALSTLWTLAQSQQTITVTTRICSTTPTSLRGTTTVQSVVPVCPYQWNDQICNGGAPFVVRIELSDPSGYQEGQTAYAASSWLLPNGNTTTDPARAGQYHVVNGQFASVDGNYASSEVGTTVQALSVSSSVGAISRTFQCSNGTLTWRNGNFTNGYAQFYKLPPNLLENARILAKLVGPMEPERSWSGVRLVPEPVSSGDHASCTIPSSSQTSGDSTAVTTGSVPSSAVPSGASSGSSNQPGPSSTTASATSNSTPIPSNVTPDGSCGPENGYSCIGTYSGSCCSEYGFCGASSEYCGIGCQSSYGLCDRGPPGSISSSSSPAAIPSTSLPGYSSPAGSSSSAITTTPVGSPSGYPDGSVPATTAPSSTPISGQQGSTTSVAPSSSAPLLPYPPGASVINTPVNCPDRSGAIVRDSNGIQYRLACTYDATPISYLAIESPGDFNYCFELCDNSAGCAGFTFVGNPNGAGPGSCYLKGGPLQLIPGNPNLVSAERITPGTGSMTRSMDSTMSMSTGQAQPSSYPVTAASSTGLIGYPGQESSSAVVSSSSSSVEVPGGYPGQLTTSAVVTSSSSSSISLPGYGDLTTSISTASTSSASSSSTSLPGYPDEPLTSTGPALTTSSASPSLPDAYPDETTSSLPEGYPDETTSSIPEGYPAETTSFTSTTTSSAPITTVQPGAPISTEAGKCPTIDGEIISDAQGYQYNVTCQADSDGGSFRTYPASGGGIQTCMAQCSNDETCNAVTYFADETQENGNCYLKREPGNVYRSNSPYIQIAIRIPGGPVSTTPTTTTFSTSTIVVPINTGDPSPTPCPITQSYGDFGDTDDGYCELTLPFDMTIYSATTRQIFPNSNGVLSLLEGTTSYDVSTLPDGELPPTSLLPFYDDLYIYLSRTSDTTSENPDATTGLAQGIYYTLSPSLAPTNLNVTWVLSRGGTYELYVFSVLYDASAPGKVTYEYRVTGGRGSGATAGGGQGDESSNDGATAGVGVQGENEDGDLVHVQWEYLEGGVGPGFSLSCDTSVFPGSCTGSDGTTVEGATTVDSTAGQE
ncbi:Chitin deacetylase [Elsinoe australis]|uniref:Chitin deacetylase n=1 Tax=Elsinoe australis TaxID=40998 RepID=A0A2P8A0K2_9PEZI|nr:Chitin deacetylase [Elsinoe australis]